VDSFTEKIAVVTGGGSGMGRELVRQLAAAGCSVAACDWHADAVAEAAALARAAAPPGARVTGHACDVSDEAQVLWFRDELLAGRASDHVDLVFANAGIGGGSSFISVNGSWAALGPGMPDTACSAALFGRATRGEREHHGGQGQ
jgi:NAD(P)-dependent dehydrogenase (short-subunit alcohol dehydrogenase family)